MIPAQVTLFGSSFCGRSWIGGLVLLAGTAFGAGIVRSPESLGLQFGPETTYITAPLNVEGYPDYVAALNERLSAGISRDENFWVLMWPAIGNAERSREEFLRQVEQRLGISISPEPRLRDPLQIAGVQWNTPEGDRLNAQWTEAMQRPWRAEEFPEIARWIEAHADVLEEVHAACLRPKAYAPLVAGGDQGPQLISVLLPHVQALRGVARLLSARAMLRLGTGDLDGSWRDLLDMQRLAGHCERGWTLIEALVGYAIRAIALQPTAHWWDACRLEPEALAARWGELQPLLQPAPLDYALDTERFMYLDTVIAIISSQAPPREVSQWLNLDPVAGGEEDESVDRLRQVRQLMFQMLLMAGDVNETLRYGNQMYGELMAALKPTTHQERAALLKVIDERVAKDGALSRDTTALLTTYLFASRQEVQSIPGRVLTGLLMPAISSVERAHTRAQTCAVLLQGAMQAVLYREQQGRLPLTSSELAEAGLAGELIDPFSGEWLRITWDEAGWMLYSVGGNGQDDGGRANGEGLNCDDLRVLLPVRE